MRVAVVGGTGVVGRHVVEALRRRGHEPVVLARSTGVDLTTGAGLDAALDGVAAAVDVSNVTTTSRKRAIAFFDTATRNLTAAAARAGVAHVVALSIVGVDRVPFGYYQGKRHQEEVLAAGTVPWTVLRATQFHEFPAQLLERMPGPVVLVPPMLSRPIAAREVGARLAELATGPALGFAPAIAGPEELRMIDMVRRLLAARGERRLVLPLPLPGPTGRAMASGGLVPDGEFTTGTETFAEFLGTPA